MIKVKCTRCGGLGRTPLRTARPNDTCFCCGGRGFITRKPPTKRLTHAEWIAQFNQRVAAGLDPNTGEPLKTTTD
jgi:hypothetical protein